MAGLVKELLLDYAVNRVGVDVRSDLTIAIQTALLSFGRTEAIYLNLYLSGYTAQEIAQKTTGITEEVEQTLQRIFTAIEHTSGYTDQNFINRLQLTKKYRKAGIEALNAFLIKHGQQYAIHEL